MANIAKSQLVDSSTYFKCWNSPFVIIARV